MGLFKKKTDPISDRAQTLNAEIAALEAKIKKLNAQAAQPKPAPQVRPAIPPAPPVPAPPPASRPSSPPASGSPPPRKKTGEPIFESVDQGPLKSPPQPPQRAQFNELGVRKYDLAGFLRRFKGHFQSRSAANPKLVNYLAAGSIQGLRPLRYEKRVARNRFIVLTIVFLAVLWGIIAVFLKHR